MQFLDRILHGVVTIAVEQFAQPGLAHQQRRRLGLDVADPLIRNPDVRTDDLVNLGHQVTLAEQFHRGEA